jgi:hypothetical protein
MTGVSVRKNAGGDPAPQVKARAACHKTKRQWNRHVLQYFQPMSSVLPRGFTVVVSTMLSVLFVFIPLPQFQFISIVVTSFKVVPIIMIRNTITITTMSFPMVSDVHDMLIRFLS